MTRIYIVLVFFLMLSYVWGKVTRTELLLSLILIQQSYFFWELTKKKGKTKAKKRKSEDDDNTLTPSEIIHKIEMKSNPTGTNN
ncbi:hypothetical protein JSO53_04130 [Riemerella anatipestifer]|uniref:hypothetical protein n=1 Tax=Riemerella anatipestifer TaxID=34085 RepID=UPI0002DE4E8B|nr:hypothetical protein [Riemerella anatipestifer]MBT0561973.1 hypothetical protein [Riemerella anatipestifer]MCU7539556.1 hypothetical protein [Riemerella anatipestifer]MCU7574277.1 hypothetical protein [Riemerella anatipestifer]MCU7595438.1 hypothetical protein [Riemerella anatipestifer]MCW0477804.1 hypothetical protein [Riemerella anatipestifer]